MVTLLINFAAHSAVILKAESLTDKIEWVKRMRSITQPKGVPPKATLSSHIGPMRQSHSDGSLVNIVYTSWKHLLHCLVDYVDFSISKKLSVVY